MKNNNKSATTTANKRGNALYEGWFSLWRQRHVQALLTSLQKIQHAPWAALLTFSVIGISLALPTLLLLMLRNVQNVSADWGNNTQISIFMKMNQSDATIQHLINQLQQDSDVSNVTYISPSEGLQQFEKVSGVTDLANTLPSNPLPAVIEIKPAAKINSPAAVQQLVSTLQELPQVDVVQLDMAWVNRLFALLNLARHAVWALALLLGLGVVLIVGNTIRLATVSNYEEIEILKLIGATNAFVRRPFLYTGALYGLAGGIIAWFLVEALFWSLADPVASLASTYQTQLSLAGLGFSGTFCLFFLSAWLGLIGAWIVVSRYLNIAKAE